MKRFIPILIIVCMLLSGCSGAAMNDAATGGAMNSGNTSSAPSSKGDSYGYASDMEMPKVEMDGGIIEESGTTGSFGTLADKAGSADFAEKIIYTANANIETIKFDESVQMVNAMVLDYGGFIENSYITGQNYRAQAAGWQTYRYAEFTIRVPSAGYKNFTENLSALGSVTSLTSGSDNITEQFYDAQARLETYAIEEDRLLSMLEKATTVEEMIQLESRLSDIRYQIESLESRLRNWQNQVDYSTVTISINEVEEYTPMVQTQRTYWQEITDGLAGTLRDIARFFMDLFKGIIVALPVLVILAAVIVVIVILIKRAIRKKRAEDLRRYKEAIGQDDTTEE